MKGLQLALAASIVLAGAPAVLAQSSVPGCHFQLGFAALHDALPSVVGDCLDDEAYAANGDSLQHTTGGLLAWRKTDNLAAFTDGAHTWVNGPNGVQERLNSERFPFEHDQLSQPELKFALLDAFGPLLYCDPDFYPIARTDEQSLALARFPQIQADAVTYRAIAAHEQLNPGALTDAQKLTIYRDYKQLTALQLQAQSDGGFAFNAQFGIERQSGVRVQGTITASGSVTVLSKQPAPYLNCPICLARGTRIATPQGDIPVEDVTPGMSVWTIDASGGPQAVSVLTTGRTAVPATHQMVDLRLTDGRQVRASPGHPTTDGRRIGDLRLGDTLDGSQVLSADRGPYDGGYTYDLLPGGGTGFYVADGIALASTLTR